MIYSACAVRERERGRARLTQVDVEGAPLLGAGVEVAALHVQVARADRLGPQPVEQRHLGPRGDAH